MKIRFASFVLACVAVSFSAVQAEDVKSGPTSKIGGAFYVKAITGDKQGTELCYVCQFGAQKKPAVVVVFTQKVDDNVATVVKAIDQVQKSNKDLGTFLVGISGVEASDLEKLQSTHKLTTPLTVGIDKDGPAKYELNKAAVVTVLVYAKGGAVHKSFGFTDTKSAAAKSAEIAAAASEVLK